MEIAGRIIVVLLMATTVLGSLFAGIPNSSDNSSPIIFDERGDVKMMGGESPSGHISSDLAYYIRFDANDTSRPIAEAGQDRKVNVGSEITFDATSSTDNVGIMNYTWSFVAGPNKETLHRLYGAVVNFTFEVAREYKVILSVTDAAGNVGYDEVVVTVEEPGGMSSLMRYESAFLASGVVLVLVAVLVMTGLVRRGRGSGSPPAAQKKNPPPEA